jgi:hypothetical protein
MRAARLAGWAGVCGLVVLASRTLGYALAPHPDIVAGHLERGLGGPRLVVVACVAIGVATMLAGAVVWFAALAVRERLAVAPERTSAPPPIQLRRLFVRALFLALASSTAFAALESYIHWRAGLGWHGVRCLTGPVHRDALPFLGSLSLVAAALAGALGHLLAWMRRTIAAILARPPRLRGRPLAARPGRGSLALRPRLLPLGASPRGPPLPLLAST